MPLFKLVQCVWWQHVSQFVSKDIFERWHCAMRKSTMFIFLGGSRWRNTAPLLLAWAWLKVNVSCHQEAFFDLGSTWLCCLIWAQITLKEVEKTNNFQRKTCFPTSSWLALKSPQTCLVFWANVKSPRKWNYSSKMMLKPYSNCKSKLRVLSSKLWNIATIC